MCPAGHFPASACAADADTVCAPCSTCPSGTYAAGACAGADTRCAACRACGSGEVATRACEGGADAECEPAVPVLLSFSVALPMSRAAFYLKSDEYIVAVGEACFNGTLPGAFGALPFRAKLARFNASVAVRSVVERGGAAGPQRALSPAVDVATAVQVLGVANAAAAVGRLTDSASLNAALATYGLPKSLTVSNVTVLRDGPPVTKAQPASIVVASGAGQDSLPLGLGLGLGLGVPVFAGMLYLGLGMSRGRAGKAVPPGPGDQPEGGRTSQDKPNEAVSASGVSTQGSGGRAAAAAAQLPNMDRMDVSSDSSEVRCVAASVQP